MAAISRIQLYGQIAKVHEQDDGTITVEGIASSEAVDSAGEIIRAAAIREALPDYLQFPALREMHQLAAAGSVMEADVGEDGITRIVAHVVDEAAIRKVKAKTYRGFSIGGKVLKRNDDNKKVIERISLSEISLVDRPCNPDAVLEMWKADGPTDEPGADVARNTEDDMTKKTDTAAAAKVEEDVEKTIEPAPITPSKVTDVAGDPPGDSTGAVGTPVAGSKQAEPSIPSGSDAKAVDVKNPEEAGQATPDPLGETDTATVEHVAPAKPTPGKDQRTRKQAAAEGEAVSGDEAVEAAEEATADDADDASVEKTDDPVAAARAAADAALKAATAVMQRLAKREIGHSPVLAEGMELRKGLSATARLGYLLCELAYCLSDAEFEKQMEGDDSQVPAKLHAAVETLAAAYKAMSDEELAELLASADATMAGQIALAAASGDLAKALDGVADSDALAKLADGEGDALTKAEGRISALETERDDLLKTVGGLNEALTALSAKVDEIADQPMPAKTVTKAADPRLVAVAKEDDGKPSADAVEEIAKAAGVTLAGPTSEDIKKALDAMDPEARAALLMKAALHPSQGRAITR